MKIELILKKINYLNYVGDLDLEVEEVIKLTPENKDEGKIFWCKDSNAVQFELCSHGIVICSANLFSSRLNKECLNFIITDKPRHTFLQVMKLFVPKENNDHQIKVNQISATCNLGLNLKIGNFNLIGNNVRIGSNVEIGSGNVILDNTVIEQNVAIGNNNTIGAVGFGYEKDEDGIYLSLPHLGNVIIRTKVEIGNNTCIDKAVLGSTIIGENVKIDNLVHIAHGVSIGRNSLIIANAMVAGSVNIGENCWIAPSSSVLNKLKIANNSIIGMGAVVLKDVDENSVIVGNPGRKLNK
tara:strand:- start:1514 stop:2404 length:891 start_codon:yes stop_codon:yes gene_type:complete